MNNFTYAVGRAAALVLFLYPIATQLLPKGWEDITLGVAAHIIVTWLNEYIHTPAQEA